MKKKGTDIWGLRLRVLILAAAAAAPPPLRSQQKESPAVTAPASLLIPMGSRALGMGGAFTAVASDPSALHYNPAGLARLNAHEVSAAFLSGQADNSLQYVAYGGPLPWPGISGSGFSSAGGSFLNSRSGTIEIAETAADGTLKRTDRISAGYDIIATLGYAERVGNTPFDMPGRAIDVNHYAGIAGKAIHSSLVEKYTATAVAGDAGYLVHSPELGVSLGLAASNLGTRLRYIDQSDPLPVVIRLGSAYQMGARTTHDLTLAGDGEFLFYERRWHANVGLEYFWNRSYGFRLGYQFKRASLGVTAGVGLRWRQRLLFDYGWGLGSGLSDIHRLTVSYRFGGVVPSARAQSSRPFMEVSPEKPRIVAEEDRPAIEEAAPPPPARPRPRAREERPSGVPGWIY